MSFYLKQSNYSTFLIDSPFELGKQSCIFTKRRSGASQELITSAILFDIYLTSLKAPRHDSGLPSLSYLLTIYSSKCKDLIWQSKMRAYVLRLPLGDIRDTTLVSIEQFFLFLYKLAFSLYGLLNFNDRDRFLLWLYQIQLRSFLGSLRLLQTISSKIW